MFNVLLGSAMQRENYKCHHVHAPSPIYIYSYDSLETLLYFVF